MYPKLREEPVDIDFNGEVLRIPRDKIVSAYAGAWAAKECLSNSLNALTLETSFKEQYVRVYPYCIEAANRVGLSATGDTLDFHNPAKGINSFLKDQLEHLDNPYYPFFEED